jgi:hypothetical protein
MPHQMNIEKNHSCIYYRFFNTLSVEELEEALAEIITIHHQQGINQVLFDLTGVKDSLGLTDLYDIGIQLSGKAFRGIPMAAFSTTPRPGAEFASTVTNKCGGSFKVFPSEPAAREWLAHLQTVSV